MNDKLYAEVGLSLIQFVGSMRFQHLMKYFQSAEAVFQADINELKRIIPPRVANLIARGIPHELVEKHLQWLCDRPNRHIISCTDSKYSSLLKNISDPPAILYAVGNVDLLQKPSVAIVGSRQCSDEGLKITEYFAEQLSQHDICITSGLAIGIDAVAHRGGLKQIGKSIAVMATGMDLIYPSQNKHLAIELAENGLLISEQPLGMKPIGKHFPQRNRIISGLSHAVIVVEATDRSGSLVTARQALDQGREVFALPGSISSPTHVGCHLLLKRGEAGLADCVEDILECVKSRTELNLKTQLIQEVKENARFETTDLFIENPSKYIKKSYNIINNISDINPYLDHHILKFLNKSSPIELDELTEKTGLNTSELLQELLMLELEDKVVADAGFFKLK